MALTIRDIESSTTVYLQKPTYSEGNIEKSLPFSFIGKILRIKTIGVLLLVGLSVLCLSIITYASTQKTHHTNSIFYATALSVDIYLLTIMVFKLPLIDSLTTTFMCVCFLTLRLFTMILTFGYFEKNTFHSLLHTPNVYACIYDLCVIWYLFTNILLFGPIVIAMLCICMNKSLHTMYPKDITP